MGKNKKEKIENIIADTKYCTSPILECIKAIKLVNELNEINFALTSKRSKLILTVNNTPQK